MFREVKSEMEKETGSWQWLGTRMTVSHGGVKNSHGCRLASSALVMGTSTSPFFLCIHWLCLFRASSKVSAPENTYTR